MPKVFNTKNKDAPKGAVYIGRGSPWGNPFEIGRDGTREQVIYKYRKWVKTNPLILEEMKHRLYGKDLLCHCAPEECHGHVILELLGDTCVRYACGRPRGSSDMSMYFGPVLTIDACLAEYGEDGDFIIEMTVEASTNKYRWRDGKWRKLKPR